MVALHHVDIGILAHEAEAAARFYGNAFIIPEVNNSGLALLKYLLEMGLSVYRRRKYNDSMGMVEKVLGGVLIKLPEKQ